MRFALKLGIALVTAVCLFGGCQKEMNIMLETAPEIIFIQIGYESSDRYDGWFIDNCGNVKSYSYTGKNGRIEYMELIAYAKELSDDAVLDTVPVSSLGEYYSLLLKVDRNSPVQQESGRLDVVLGRREWYGNRLDDNGNMETIILHGTGDVVIKNTDRYAQQILPWLLQVNSR